MNNFEIRYKRLNKEQREAADSLYGSVLVVAGPGAGKTEILALRVANILKKTDTLPQEILCLTFTDSAASNMKQRLQDFIGNKAFKVNISTFHSLGVNIINKYPEYFYKGANFNPADQVTQTEIIKDIIKDLEFDNPLKKSHSEQGFIYLRPIKKSITALKRAGLTTDEFGKILDKNKEELKFINSTLQNCLSDRVSKSNFENYWKSLEKIKNKKENNKIPHIEDLTSVIGRSFEKALKEAEEKEKTKPITRWKRKWTKKEEGEIVFKDTKYTEKLKALAEIYKEYQKRMYEKGYYDFDDMLLDVIQVLSKNESFRKEIQEEFSFILVDEFQDTNEAQMRLLHLLTGKEKSNIFVVGDDDQAIFKFQGAEVENIHKFKKRYKDTKIITLLKNYRSSENVLKTAKFIIEKGEKRLENIIPQIQKRLESVNKNKEKEFINHYKFKTKEEEYYWIAKKIKENIEKKENPDTIAVISRYHKDLQKLVPFLSYFDIPISYEREQNILEEPYIEQIIQIIKIVIHLSKNKKREALSLLPEVLSYPFWEIKREELLKLASESKLKRRDWLECMLNKKGKLNNIANFFLELSNRANYEPLEKMIDFIIGTKSLNIRSPFREYYFDNNEKGDKFWFLSSLQTFIQKIRDYKQQEFLKLEHLLDFVRLHNEINLPLINKSKFTTGENKVNLLSAHKAKGKEFDSVFVLNCQDKIWAKKGRYSILPFPQNLRVKPGQEDIDDQLRLFYVVLTRARHELILTSFAKDEKGREFLPLQFLVTTEEEIKESKSAKLLSPEEKEITKEERIEALEKSITPSFFLPETDNQKALLSDVLDKYKLSVTHLNNFLDITQGGPHYFLEQNLLRFPKAKTPGLCFGTAMHQTMDNIYMILKKEGEVPSLDKVFSIFKKLLKNQPLNEREFKELHQRGKKALENYYKEKKGSFKPEHLVEFNFSSRGVEVKGCPITGKIDKIEKKGKEMIVTDFKTGKSVNSWKGKGDYEKIKLWKYKNQLIFYKLLIENSKDFGDKYRVEEGQLEFLEPDKKERLTTLNYKIKEKDIKRMKKLIDVVSKKIQMLDFPKIDKYDSSYKGIQSFEKDLI